MSDTVEQSMDQVDDNDAATAQTTNQEESTEGRPISWFKDFRLSRSTLSGLDAAHYYKPTEIQRESIGLAMRGHDILGAAKTGSGKTLAFLVPMLECLHRERWSQNDGVGAIVITPTRELAYQIFEVLKKIGKFHSFSAGLVIGGKDLKFERNRMDRLNIIICTPGRLKQHMDENYLFQCDNLKMLIIDEADRILDMGFEHDMNAIIEFLPRSRQCLLFSATQTRSVKDLARLSLKDPILVSVHENSKVVTPESLGQSYIVLDLHQKLNFLWTFFRDHKRQKILVFLATCKQTKYVHDLFCRMRPGTTLLALYGTLHQLKRMKIYEQFCKLKHAILVATDVVARGLDFPNVDWVIQLDCPEDVTCYIHRAGRTARLNKVGQSLLVLMPHEKESMLEKIEKRGIPINESPLNPQTLVWTQRKAEALCARDVQLKDSAKRAFKAYLKYLANTRDKSVFDPTKIDLTQFAQSLGLAITPRVRMLERRSAKRFKATSEESVVKPDKKANKPKAPLSGFNLDASDSDNDDNFLVPKGPADIPDDNEVEPEDVAMALEPHRRVKPISKAAVIKKELKKKNIVWNKRIVFDDSGAPISESLPNRQRSSKAQNLKSTNKLDIDLAKEIMQEEDKLDREVYKSIRKEKVWAKKKKLKQKHIAEKGDGGVVFDTNDDDEGVDDIVEED